MKANCISNYQISNCAQSLHLVRNLFRSGDFLQHWTFYSQQRNIHVGSATNNGSWNFWHGMKQEFHLPIPRYPMQPNDGMILHRHPTTGTGQMMYQYRSGRPVGAIRFFKHIDFDRFTPEAMAEQEKRRSGYVVGYKKKKEREHRDAKKARLAEEERTKYTFNYDQWKEVIDAILILDDFPVGFSNSYETSIVALWCQQVSNSLQQTLSLNAATSLDPALLLLDRLFQEEEAHVPAQGGVQVLMSSDVSSSAIESAMKSWKMSLMYPPYYENMTKEMLTEAQDRIAYYGNFLAKHDDSMLGQISKLLDPERIFTKTPTTDRLLWGYIPHTRHPNADESNVKRYLNFDGEFNDGDEDDVDVDVDNDYDSSDNDNED
jgi:hypothetical protein